jgi:hypothetical protein
MSFPCIEECKIFIQSARQEVFKIFRTEAAAAFESFCLSNFPLIQMTLSSSVSQLCLGYYFLKQFPLHFSGFKFRLSEQENGGIESLLRESVCEF